MLPAWLDFNKKAQSRPKLFKVIQYLLDSLLYYITPMPIRISAIISDFDGTLCPTGSVKTEDGNIPPDLQNVLWSISEKIPICIISSKDFYFLKEKTQFASIISAIIDTEILQFTRVNNKKVHLFGNELTNGGQGVNRFLNTIAHNRVSSPNDLLKLSEPLEELAKLAADEFQDLSVEYKYTYVEKILAGITLDYRHLQKWQQYKSNIEPNLAKMIHKFSSLLPNKLHVQTYLDHPFIDIYPIKRDKAQAVNTIVSLLRLNDKDKFLYLGDSENDNNAFKMADLSIGVHSDPRIMTKLESDYLIEFNELRPFLQRLETEDFVFYRMSENIA